MFWQNVTWQEMRNVNKDWIERVARRKLTKDQREEAIRRLRKGEGISTVADAVKAPRSAVAKTKERSVRASGTATTGGKVIGTRLSEAEMEAFERLKDRYGYRSNADAMRGMVRMAVGILEFEPEVSGRLDAVRSELHKIGVNVNQVALSANRGRVDLMKHHWEAINELRRELPKVRIFLQAIVDEQRRRGIRLFQKFAEVNGG